MTEPIRRAIRTWLQAFLGTIVTSGILSAMETTGVVDWSSVRKVLVAAVAAGVIAVITWAQNALEDASGRAILKGEAGHSTLDTVCLVVVAVILVLWALGEVPR